MVDAVKGGGDRLALRPRRQRRKVCGEYARLCRQQLRKAEAGGGVLYLEVLCASGDRIQTTARGCRHQSTGADADYTRILGRTRRSRHGLGKRKLSLRTAHLSKRAPKIGDEQTARARREG